MERRTTIPAPGGPLTRRALLLASLLLTACADGPAPRPATRERPFVVSRAGLRALGDYVQAGYELRLLHDRAAAGEAVTTAEAERADTRRALARGQLLQALREDGADPARLADEEDALALALEGVKNNLAYAFSFPADDDSFSIVRVAADVPSRTVVLFGAPFRYRLVTHDETVVDDYPGWCARRRGGPAVATYQAQARDGAWTGVVRVDLAAARAIGEAHWLPHVEALRDAARRAQDDAAFLALAEQHAALLDLARAALRWRSLEGLWSLVGSRAKDEQLARFAEDYAARAELRVAAELRELGRLRAATAEPPPALSAEERARLSELGALSAMVHGEPLGVLADLLGHAVRSLSGGAPDEPTALAARRLVVELGARAGGEGAGASDGSDPARDALKVAALARAAPEQLRAWATELHRERLRAP